jgi:alpha-amylase
LKDWSERVWYEVFVRSFADSDGDGIGDLRGLTSKLDYLNDGDPSTSTDLGIGGLWLMPIMESPSYHGYDVVDYMKVEPDYGTLADFKAFLGAAHERGIEVIVDLVLNHTSVQHPWFRDAQTPGSDHDGWYVWADANPGYAGPDGQPVWHPDANRFYYGLFGEGLPDLNLRNPAVTDALEQVARYWLGEVGVDGFRLDAIKHLVESGSKQEDTPDTHAWLAAFHDRVRGVNDDAFLVGEVFDLTLVSSSYVPRAVDATFDFELAGKIILGSQIGDAGVIAGAQRETLAEYPERAYAAFLTNHDQARVMTQLSERGAGRVAASVLLTNPGVPFVYYGEELGLTGGKPDEQIRTPMPWTPGGGAGFTSGTPWEPLADGWETRNVAAESSDPASLLAHYRALIQVRKDHAALRSGAFAPVTSSTPAVYAFLATRSDDAVAAIINLGSEPVSDYHLSLDTGGGCGLRTATGVYGDGVPATDIEPPAVTPAGTFEAWRPLPALPAYATVVVALGR